MIIIPARLKSSRFEKKVLVDIFGVPMFVATANRVKDIERVVIATDSQEVVDVANRYGYDAYLTSTEHKSGTDRINEVANILDIDEDEPIINLQADEPFIEKEVVEALYKRTKDIGDAMIVSCYKKIDKNSVDDPNLVKVVVDVNGYAIYFSRSKIPYDRESFDGYFGHLGLYGFSKKSLNQFCTLRSSPLEEVEKLEQLRAIYHGKKIAMVEVKSRSFGIDTIDDLKRALKTFG